MTMPDYPVNRSIGAAAPGALGASGIGGGGGVLPQGFSGAAGGARTARITRVLKESVGYSNSTTLTAATGMSFPMSLLEVWSVEMMLWYDAAIAADMKWDITMPAGAIFMGWAQMYDQNDVVGTFPVDAATALVAGGAAGTFRSVIVHGLAYMYAATAKGVFQLRYAQNVGNVYATTMYKGSFLRAERMLVLP